MEQVEQVLYIVMGVCVLRENSSIRGKAFGEFLLAIRCSYGPLMLEGAVCSVYVHATTACVRV